jgi:alpha-N-arabinofuranosidase
MPHFRGHIVLSAVAVTAGCLIAAFGQSSSKAPDVVTVAVNQPVAEIAPTMFGIFFEDINFAADGGLYPERVKNRSFEFTEPLSGWTRMSLFGGSEGELDVRTDSPLNENNPHYLRMHVDNPGPGFGVVNPGFRGIGVESGSDYVFSAYVRTPIDGPHAIQATLVDESGKTIGKVTLNGFGREWKKYEATMRPTETTQHAVLNVFVQEKGDVDLDMVSLYPKDTWNSRPNGLRKDLVQLLADMKPGFMRFPGGCIVEGRRLALRYQWKKTVGDVSERRTIVNRWNNEFDTKPAPDYFQSFGLGFYEYFQLAEDIGASPLPILNCGMACEFNSSETAPLDSTKEYIQDALDLIEFANGSATTAWGGLRAKMGHPAAFNLKMIGVGNEQWGPRYLERYRLFAAALKAKHPEIELVASAGPSPEGKEFDTLWSNLRELKADLIDEHYYASPDWFLSNTGRYDRYDRSGPKVFAGEYAAQTAGIARPDNRNNWNGAIAEAAFMTGLERNADVVRMASYAPLFAHVDAWQWTPDLIWFDNLRSYGTTNYQVQKLFANNVGTRIAPVTIDGQASNAHDGLYASGSLNERTREVIVKAVNATPRARPVRIALSGISGAKPGREIVLAGDDPAAENSMDAPRRVVPVETAIQTESGQIQASLQPYSVTVFRVPYGH